MAKLINDLRAQVPAVQDSAVKRALARSAYEAEAILELYRPGEVHSHWEAPVELTAQVKPRAAGGNGHDTKAFVVNEATGLQSHMATVCAVYNSDHIQNQSRQLTRAQHIHTCCTTA